MLYTLLHEGVTQSWLLVANLKIQMKKDRYLLCHLMGMGKFY